MPIDNAPWWDDILGPERLAQIERNNDIMDDLPEPEAREQISRERTHRRCWFCEGVCVPTGSCHTCQSCGETNGCG